jgi:hypothetical protein
MKIKLLCLAAVAVLLSCTSPGIEKVPRTSDVYEVGGNFYVKRIFIEGDRIYFRCDKDGNILSGPVSVHYQAGKAIYNVSFPE